MGNKSNTSDQAQALKRTPFYALHEGLGAKFASFAGYTMPIEYGHGIKHEHIHTRTAAGFFDISHMGQITIRGPALADDFERLVPSDIGSLALNNQRYSVLTNDNGGIIDDIMITRLADQLYVVVNAAFKSDDLHYIADRLGPKYTVEMDEDRALIALQGPAAAKCLSKWDDAVTRLQFLQAGHFRLAGMDCLVHRCGYTGGDGFEISIAAGDAPSFAEMLLQDDSVEPVGLGARDTLRLEAGLCLAGTDFDGTITPIEAALTWVIARKYRIEPQQTAEFPGAAVILKQLKHGVSRRRVGLASQGRIPVRHGTALLHRDRQVGHVTSGGYGPSFGAPIAMGYVEYEFVESGTELQVVIRGRSHSIRVADLPFVPYTYHRN